MKNSNRQPDLLMKEQLIADIILFSCYRKEELIGYPTEIILQLYKIYVNMPNSYLASKKNNHRVIKL